MGGGDPHGRAQSEADAAEIAAWLRTWAGAGSLSLAEEVKGDPDWQRGETLLGLGLRSQALANWGRVQKRYEKNAWVQAALALAFRDAGAHRLSLLSAEQVVSLSGKAMGDVPAGFSGWPTRSPSPISSVPKRRNRAWTHGCWPRSSGKRVVLRQVRRHRRARKA